MAGGLCQPHNQNTSYIKSGFASVRNVLCPERFVSGTFCVRNVLCPERFLSGTFLTLTLNVNNSVILQLRSYPKVANEWYCNIFSIFGVVWGKGVATQGVLKSFRTTKIGENRRFLHQLQRPIIQLKKFFSFFFKDEGGVEKGRLALVSIFGPFC